VHVVFSVTEAELLQLEKGGESMGRDCFWFSLPLTVSCLLNGMARYFDKGKVDSLASLNFYVATAFGTLVIVSALGWWKSKNLKQDIAAAIRAKPKLEVQIEEKEGSYFVISRNTK
jgi:hypothetical protein